MSDVGKNIVGRLEKFTEDIESNNVGELLAKHSELLNLHGPNSDEVKDLVNANSHNKEFCDLARTARHLKIALLRVGEEPEDW